VGWQINSCCGVANQFLLWYGCSIESTSVVVLWSYSS